MGVCGLPGAPLIGDWPTPIEGLILETLRCVGVVMIIS